MDNREIKVEIQTLGRKYDFIVNGYKVSVTVPIYDTVGMHPLEILLKDLLTMADTVKNLERFQSAPGELPPAEPRVKLEDILKNNDSPQGV